MLFPREFATIMHSSMAFSLAEPQMFVPFLRQVVSHGNRFSGL